MQINIAVIHWKAVHWCPLCHFMAFLNHTPIYLRAVCLMRQNQIWPTKISAEVKKNLCHLIPTSKPQCRGRHHVVGDIVHDNVFSCWLL